MLARMIAFFTLTVLMVACQPTLPANGAPTPILFPTMTVGQTIYGDLSAPDVLVSENNLANPATVAANVARPTPTPNLRSCPAVSGGLSLAVLPDSAEQANQAIANFLTLGGSLTDLEDQMLNDWKVLGTDGFIRTDTDMTGEGTPDIIVSYRSPGDLGALSIFTCSNGEYLTRYQVVSIAPAPPQLLWLGDINHDFRNDLVYSMYACDEEETCEYTSQVVTWEIDRGRFVNLVNGTIRSFNLPTLNDIDNDEVAEIIITLDNRGTSATGPLRTGVNIYDWNGSLYTLSIIQLDPPRYRIQLIHEADRLFGRLQTRQAEELYRQAFTDEDLRFWFNDEPNTLMPYIVFRLLMMTTYNGDIAARDEVLAQLHADYPITETTDPSRMPVYVEMSYAFLAGWDATQNMSNACQIVGGVIENRPQAVELLNRYGIRGPQYTAKDLCPF